MDQAEKTMIANLSKNTGKTLKQWVEVVKKENLSKHGEMVKFLKEEHSFTHGFANLVAHKVKGSDAGSVENKEDLLQKQYKGKEHFLPVYEKLITAVQGFGKDVGIAPKNSYVSLRRKKQFAILQPATKSRFEIGLNIKGQESKGKLEPINAANTMCSHKINVATASDVDGEVLGWIRLAYDHAG